MTPHEHQHPSDADAAPAARRTPLSRRHALAGAATVGLGLPVLAACGAEDGGTGAGAPPTGGTPDGAPAGGSSGRGGAGAALLTTSEVAVGGGVVLPDAGVVVVQPSEGEFKGYTATCTHQGCLVTEVVDGGIHCPCHASVFDIQDGSVVAGPATVPLPEVRLEVTGQRITLG